MTKGSIPLINDSKGVSPVIAVILMVAITVVLSGVVFLWASSFTQDASGDLELTMLEADVRDDPVGDRIGITIIKGSIEWGNARVIVIPEGGSEIYADLSATPDIGLAGDTQWFDSFVDDSNTPVVFDQNKGDLIEIKVVNLKTNSVISIIETKIVH